MSLFKLVNLRKNYLKEKRKGIHDCCKHARTLLLRLPVGRGGVVNSLRFCFFFHLSMSKVGLPLMGDTAGFSLLFSALLHII